MLIRVLLENKEEGLFNADCQVVFLLDAIKLKHKIPQSEIIDLCNPDGTVKELYLHGDENATSFFKLRELCLVVKVQDSETTHPFYTPVLQEYAANREFLAYLNHKAEGVSCCVRLKMKHNPNVIRTRTPVDAFKQKSGGKNKKRRGSAFKAK